MISGWILDCIYDVTRSLESGRGYASAVSSLMSLSEVDLGCVPEPKRNQLIQKILAAANRPNGPLLILSLPQNIQAEIALFMPRKIPGIDRTAYRKAMPGQVVRKLTGTSSGDGVADLLRANYDFSKFKKEHWEEYFSRSSLLLPAAQAFLARDEAHGGFSSAELTNILLRNPSLVPSVPCDRIVPDAAVALLISGRGESLWNTYDFSSLTKDHWLQLFQHTNPESLPEACRPFIENKDGKGFSDDELLGLAYKCHALINFLNPSKVPFKIVYELSLTGRADLLWKNYPFASLDKAEWRMVLENPAMRIPDFFLSVVEGGRFTVDELCKLAIHNDRLLPILLKLDITPERIIKILLASKADYVWENYHFSRFSVADWLKLILGLKGDAILKPRAMMALKACRDLTKAHVRRILSKNPAYAPNVPISAIAPDVAVELLIQGKCRFLWTAYDFKRLDDDQWLRLLGNSIGEIPPLGKDFLRYRAGGVDNDRLNAVLARRRYLIGFVDAKYISPELAASVLIDNPEHELLNRFDFTRLDAKQLIGVIKAHKYISGAFPKSLEACFKKEGAPFGFQDLLELAAINPCIVVDNISTEWVESLDDGAFDRLARLSVENDSAFVSLRQRLTQGERPWNTLPRNKLKCLLKLAPGLRFSVGWENWAFRDIADLAKSDATFERGIAHPIRYFIWKHWTSLLAMGALTAAALVAICMQNRALDRQEAQRQHLNSIVQSVRDCDQNQSYRELKELWTTIALNDQAILTNDLFVKRAFENQAVWEADCEAIESCMSRLREMSKSGWGSVTEDAVGVVVSELEKRHVDRFAVYSEFQFLTNAHAEYRKQQAERLRIKALRDKLADINARLSDCEDLAQLVKWKASLNFKESALDDEVANTSVKLTRRIDKIQTNLKQAAERRRVKLLRDKLTEINGQLSDCEDLAQLIQWKESLQFMTEEQGLKDEVNRTLGKLTRRIDQVNAAKIAQEVEAISNAVIYVSGELKKPTALKEFSSWSAEYFRISEMPGFDEYGKLPCYGDYIRLSEDVETFDKLKRGTADKLLEARRLDEKFSKEFMTEEAGTACSNVIVYCEKSLKVTNSKGWAAFSKENEKIKKIIEDIYSRDLRCWSLVDRINSATDYAGYYKARAELIKDFGHFDQFKHLEFLCNLEPADLAQSYTTREYSRGGGLWNYTFLCRYYFVGVIRIHPESLSRTAVYVLPGTTTDTADVYTLWKSASGEVSSMKIISKLGPRKFSEVAGVDYSNCQGTPLFVRAEHYLGKGK